jgi:hydroxylamine dehydrogenase
VKHIALLIVATLLLSWTALASAAEVSDATDECLSCHTMATPGIVADWKRSRHYKTSVAEALKLDPENRRVSAEKVPESLADVSVGCAECHTLNSDKHPGSFDHEGVQVHTVVSPNDCAVCHPTEADQYKKNKMSHAWGILTQNPLYKDLMGVINGVASFENGEIKRAAPNQMTTDDSCLQCHGTKVEVAEIKTRETDLGDFEIPMLKGWPNQGVGRINPDGSKGACTSCHTRHQFSMAMARKPYTCSQCHKGPDVPAYKVYEVSKHGNLHSSLHNEWDFDAVPWVVGRDITAPTCAACHASLIKDTEGNTVAERTHQFNDRLPWRLFGLPYAHHQPKDPDTSKIRNKSGLPLPTDLSGEPASDYLIDNAEVQKRTTAMKKVCQSCHSGFWTDGHWTRMLHTIETTNAMTLAATNIVASAWKQGVASGPPDHSPFDESLERQWVEQWLFFANSTRLAAAMGGADYGVFDNGRWYMSRNLQDMAEWLKIKTQAQKK